MDYEQVLSRLCALPGPSGFEQPVAQAVSELLRPWMDEVTADRMGNVVGVRRCGRENAPRLLLDAHLDEIGFLVTGHEHGFLRFAPLGGVDPRMLPDREITLLTQPPRLGVVACMPPHIQTREDMDRSQPIRELYLDVGLSQEESQRLIPVGTPAVYRTGCAPVGEHCFVGKALDDRACIAILLDTVEQLAGEALEVDLYVLASTQEETHSTGAIAAAYGIVPQMCVAVDVTHGDSPDAPKERRSGDRRRPQLYPLDGPAPGALRQAAGDGLSDRSHVGQQRHQRLAPPDQPGGRGHRRAVRPAALYAHPGGDGPPQRPVPDRRAAGRLSSRPGRGGAPLFLKR